MSLPLRAIGVFHTVARLASISKAASELGVTPSAVSQQIHALETALGSVLLVKNGRRIKLSEAGERYFEMISGDVEHIAEATDRIRGYHSITTLTVRASPSLATKWLLPRLASFVDAHPQFEVRLDGTNEPTDFSREDVDLQIRHGEGQWSGLFVEGLAKESFVPACAPDFVTAASLTGASLTRHRLIHSVKSQVQWPTWFKSIGVQTDQRWRRVLFDRSHMAIDAAAAGMGIVLESNLMMWRELAEGRLVCPIPDPPSVMLITQWIVCPHDHLRHAKVRAFIDWLHKERDRWAASSGRGARLKRAQPR